MIWPSKLFLAIFNFLEVLECYFCKNHKSEQDFMPNSFQLQISISIFRPQGLINEEDGFFFLKVMGLASFFIIMT